MDVPCPGPLVALLLIGLGSLLAPTAAKDVQVPVDSDSTVYSIGPDLRTAAELFPEVSGFEGAALYRVDKECYELMIRY